MRSMFFVTVAAALLFSARADAQNAPAATVAGPTHKQVLDCIRTVVGTDGADETVVSQVLVNGCAACPGWKGFEGNPSDFGGMLAEHCGLYCSATAKAAFAAAPRGEKWSALANQCKTMPKPPAELAALRSDDWMVFEQLGRFAARAVQSKESLVRQAGEALVNELKQRRFRLPLAGKVDKLYALPQGGETDSGLPPDVCIVVQPNALLSSLCPTVMVTPEGLRLFPVPEGQFPGTPVLLPELFARVEKLNGMMLGLGEKHGNIIVSAYMRREIRRREASDRLKPRNGIPQDSPEQKAIDGLRASAPLVLADRSLPVSQVFAVVDSLGKHGARLAIDWSGTSGPLRPVIGAARHFPSFKPTVRLEISESGYKLQFGAEPAQRVARSGEKHGLKDLQKLVEEHSAAAERKYLELSAKTPGQLPVTPYAPSVLAVSCSRRLPWSELVEATDAFLSGRFELALWEKAKE